MGGHELREQPEMTWEFALIMVCVFLWAIYARHKIQIEQANQREKELEMSRIWRPTQQLAVRLADEFLIERTPEEIQDALVELFGTVRDARIYAEACINRQAPILPIIQATSPINHDTGIDR